MEPGTCKLKPYINIYIMFLLLLNTLYLKISFQCVQLVYICTFIRPFAIPSIFLVFHNPKYNLISKYIVFLHNRGYSSEPEQTFSNPPGYTKNSQFLISKVNI